MNLENIKKIISSFKKGQILIVTDDKNRENEADLVISSEFVSPKIINFFISYAKGLVCCAISENIAQRLDLKPMIQKNTSLFLTNFTNSIDLKEKTTTGISCSDRAHTLKAIGNKNSKFNDFSSPGHIFPIIAKKNGLKARRGHTEAAIDLCKMNNLPLSAVICEILNEKGEMARGEELIKFSKKHQLPIISIKEIITVS